MPNEANEFPMGMKVSDGFEMEDFLRALGDDGLNDFLDVLTLFQDQNEQHGCDRPETILTDDSPNYFREHGGTSLAFGSLETVLQAHNDLRQSGNHRPVNVCYDEEGQFYLFQ